MAMLTPSAGGDYGYNLAVSDRIFTGAMTGLYGWTAVGLGIAGAVGWVLHAAGVYVGLSLVGMIVGLVIGIGSLFAMQFAANRGWPMVLVGGLYVFFTAVMGAVLSTVLLVYSGTNIMQAFVGACGLFAVMSVFGFTTKKDLSKLGAIAIFALIGMVVVGLINALLFRSSGLQLLLSVITLPIFMALIAWETQDIKGRAREAAAEGNSDAAARIALVGAAAMFLNIVNLFLALLHILNFFGGDD